MTEPIADGAARTVLLAGGTGMLGGRIAAHLAEDPRAALRLLVRPGAAQDPARAARLRDLTARGARTVEADLTDRAALDAALDGVDVVVSALQGGRDVIVDGQVALARAAARGGARRILPSDFAVDLFKATPGEHALFDLRREADDVIADLGLEHVHVLNGAFLDQLVHVFDHDAAVATYWGTGDETFDGTTVDDTARYTALAALDPDLGSGKLAVAGDRVSFGGMADAVEAATGRRYQRRSLGTVDDLRAAIERDRRAGADPMAVVMQVYLLYMLGGQTALEDLQNDRYPQVRPQTFADVARTALAAPAVVR